MILSGGVLVNDQRMDKPGIPVDPHAKIRLKRMPPPYVSRGGLKLEAAIRRLQLSVKDSICLDLGASTGGFTDCLLQHGASKIFAFDVGRGQLDWKLRTDPRVEVRERFNVRYLKPEHVPQEVDLIAADLSFISLRRILPALKAFPRAKILTLVKPQFEARREELQPGGLITDPEKATEIVQRVIDFATREGFRFQAQVPSPIRGRKGNREFFLLLRMTS